MGLPVLGFLIAGAYGPIFHPFDFIPAPPAQESEDPTETGLIGCTDQYLVEGVQLPENPDLYTITNHETAWGTEAMIDVVVDTAARMRDILPKGDPLIIGDISMQHGGRLEPHKSHRGGIDTDIVLYSQGGRQDPGLLNPVPGTGLDIPANWFLISTLLQTDMVDMILLDAAIIRQLRLYTVSAGFLDPDEATRIFPAAGSRQEWASTGVVRHAPLHTGHIHVRVLCGDGSRAR